MSVQAAARSMATLALCMFLGGTAAAEPVRFVTIDTAPWASVEPKSGKAEGVFPDIVAELVRRTGLDILVELQPFARIPRELETSRQDCTILVWNEQWAPFMVQGEVVSNHPVGVIARKGLRLRSYENLRGLSVSVLRGLPLGPRFDGDESVHRQYDTDYLQGLNKLAHGRVDAVAGALPTIAYLAEQNGLDRHLGDRLELSQMLLRFQCAKGSPRLDVMPAIDAAIRAMLADGTIERIKASRDYH
ncbi:substrate-binding periplasmic protein [Magnetospirillum sp. ME-1]|uniref:substrate-binding periplasmic protein n=1 Tax=Magnetospirillum sp. ME-1 TaxID=1639348 RepID=UPI000A18DB69|nr:transporter substrate-binding domain-containing protein [Magnetospirillum sp. ME-1]